MPENSRTPAPLSRRRFLKLGCWGVASGALMCGLGATYALKVEPAWIELAETEVWPSKWPGALDGFTIAQLSDIHRGPDVDMAHIRRGVTLANQRRRGSDRAHRGLCDRRGRLQRRLCKRPGGIASALWRLCGSGESRYLDQRGAGGRQSGSTWHHVAARCVASRWR